MHRRKPLSPDLRPDWRDPNMPVMLNCIDKDTGRQYLKSYTPERATYAFSVRMQISSAPDWQNDPTYNLRKDK